MRPSILFHLANRNKKNLSKADEIPVEWKTIYYKKYPRLPRIVLPEAKPFSISLSEALLNRKSERAFDQKKSITLGQLSDFLYWSAGIKNKELGDHGRMYPSGGARYPLEIYPIVFRAEDFKAGIYHYRLDKHLLERLADESWLRQAKTIFVSEDIQKAAAIFIITAVFERTMMKYQDFGYRLVLEEAGHLCQNFYLAAAAMDFAACGLGGFYDEPANEILDIDGINEAAIYAFALGNKQKR